MPRPNLLRVYPATLTAAFTESLQDRYETYPCDTSSAGFTFTLAPASSKRRIKFVMTGTGTNALTIARGASDTIDGATSITLVGQYNTLILEADGSASWYANNGNKLYGVTDGTAVANKALVLNSSKGISTITSATITTLTATTANVTTINPTSIVRASQTFQLGRGGTAKAGTTAGWTVNAGNNLGTIATVAQSQTNSTLVVAIPNLHVGDTITGFSVYSSINSAGNAVTLDANLRTLTIAAGASATDASVASITQVSVTSATASSATKSGLSTVVAAGVNYYLLLTCSTAASTTLELSQIEVTVTSA